MLTHTMAVSRIKNFYQKKLYESSLSPFYNPEYSIYDERDNTFDLEARITVKHMLSKDRKVSLVEEVIKLLEEESTIVSIFSEIANDELWKELNEGVAKILKDVKDEFGDLDEGIPYIETRRDFSGFGDFLEFKRKERSLTVTAAAKALGVSRRYYSDVEKGARSPFDKKNLIMLAEVFNFNEYEKEKMFDLAAKGRREMPLDIVAYLTANDYMYGFIRGIKDADIDEKRLFSFLSRVKRKKK